MNNHSYKVGDVVRYKNANWIIINIIYTEHTVSRIWIDIARKGSVYKTIVEDVEPTGRHIETIVDIFDSIED